MATHSYSRLLENVQIKAFQNLPRSVHARLLENVQIKAFQNLPRSVHARLLENVQVTPFQGAAMPRSASFRVLENVIALKNPYRMMTYDSTTGQYVAAPWYIWNGTAWVQAV